MYSRKFREILSISLRRCADKRKGPTDLTDGSNPLYPLQHAVFGKSKGSIWNSPRRI